MIERRKGKAGLQKQGLFSVDLTSRLRQEFKNRILSGTSHGPQLRIRSPQDKPVIHKALVELEGALQHPQPCACHCADTILCSRVSKYVLAAQVAALRILQIHPRATAHFGHVRRTASLLGRSRSNTDPLSEFVMKLQLAPCGRYRNPGPIQFDMVGCEASKDIF